MLNSSLPEGRKFTTWMEAKGDHTQALDVGISYASLDEYVWTDGTRQAALDALFVSLREEKSIDTTLI